MNLARPLLVVLTSLLGLAGCPADPRDDAARSVVARVGDTAVTRERVLAELTWAGVARSGADDTRLKLAQGILDRIVEGELLLIGAAKADVTVPDDEVAREVRRAAAAYPPGTFERVLVAEQMGLPMYEDRIRRRLIVDQYLRRIVEPTKVISDVDVRAYYDREVAKKVRPAQALARQILVKTEEEAQHLLKEIRARRIKFDDAARRFSAAPERDQGGLLGWFSRGELPDVFDLVFALPPGQVSDVVASDYGFHIFELLDRRDEGVEPFAQAEERIILDLRREREEVETRALLAKLRREVPISLDLLALEQAVKALPDVPRAAEYGPDPSPAGAFANFAKDELAPAP